MRFTSALHLSKQTKYCPLLVQWRGEESKTALFGSTMSALWEKIFRFGVSAITRLYFEFRNQLYCPSTQTVFHSLKICHNYCLLYPFKSITHMIIIKPLNAELNPICHLLALLAHHILHISRIRVNYDAAQYARLKKTLFNTTQAIYYITYIFYLYSDCLGIHF